MQQLKAINLKDKIKGGGKSMFILKSQEVVCGGTSTHRRPEAARKYLQAPSRDSLHFSQIVLLNSSSSICGKMARMLPLRSPNLMGSNAVVSPCPVTVHWDIVADPK